VTVNLEMIVSSFDEERTRKSAYEAQMRSDWKAGEGHRLALITARHIRAAMDAGAKKSDILRALGHKFYGIIDGYLELLANEPAHNNPEDSVKVLRVDENEVMVTLKNYEINGDFFTGVVEYNRDEEDGDWLYADDSDMALAVDNELFFYAGDGETVLQRKWASVVS
jgi:hypothetical protein